MEVVYFLRVTIYTVIMKAPWCIILDVYACLYMYAWSECMHGVQEGSPKIFEKLCIFMEPLENKATCVCLENRTNSSMIVNVPSNARIKTQHDTWQTYNHHACTYQCSTCASTTMHAIDTQTRTRYQTHACAVRHDTWQRYNQCT